MKTLYLDQNQLSNLAKPGQEALRQRVLALLKSDEVQVAVSYPHILETAAIGAHPVLGAVVRQASPLIDEIADFLDDAPVVKMWSAFEIMRVEFLNAAEAYLLGRPLAVLSPFGDWDFIGNRVRAMTFRAEVSRVRLTPSILTQYWRTAGSHAQWKNDMKANEAPPPDAKFTDLLLAEARAIADLYLRNRNYEDHWPPQMSQADREKFVKSFRPSLCPALSVYVALSALERATRAKGGTPRRSRPNDLIDIQAAAAAAYCNDFITERGLADQIKQVRKHEGFLGTFKARVLTDPEEYLSAGERVA